MINYTNNNKYLIEITPPKQKADKFHQRIETFKEKYLKYFDSGNCICIPDNAMGHLSFQGVELIKYFKLPVNQEQIMIHLNTFHTKKDIDSTLTICKELAITNVLIVSGDGSERLPRLQPKEFNLDINSITSVELLNYITKKYDNYFNLGAAFNQYEPIEYEKAKLKEKIEAGAKYIITQPILERDDVIDIIKKEFDIPIFVEAWMSKNVNLLADCIGYDLNEGYDPDPINRLKTLKNNYKNCGVYLALLGYKTQFPYLESI